MNKKKFAMVKLYETCNYRCSYCNIPDTLRNESLGKSSIRENMNKMVDFFDESGEWHIYLTGGEPSVHPYFIDLCRRITQKHSLAMCTNNSMNLTKLNEFVNTIDYKKVDYIQCSLQEIDEEGENFERFFNNIMILKKNNFRVYVTYVATPDRINKIPKYYKKFMSNGVAFVIQNFMGVYNGKLYPKSYTQEEFQILDKYMVSSMYRGLLSNGYRKTTFKLCPSGNRRIFVDASNGDIQRCTHEKNSLGNIYDKVVRLDNEDQPCNSRYCDCFFEFDSSFEELIIQDYENIFSGHSHYMDDLVSKYKQLSVGTEKYDLYWNERDKIKREKQIKKLNKIFDKQYKKIGIYGTGRHTERLLESYKNNIGDIKFEIIFFNSNKNLFGTKYLNHIIYSPKEIPNLNLDKVIISSYSFQEEMYENLVEKIGYKGKVEKIYNKDDEIIFI